MADRLPNLWCNRCMSLVREIERSPDGTHTICGKMLAIVDDDEPDAAELEAEVDALREFCRWAINASHFGVSDLCAEEIQDKAIELGLLRVVPWDGLSPVDGDEDRMQPGDPVYVESDLLCGDEHA